MCECAKLQEGKRKSLYYVFTFVHFGNTKVPHVCVQRYMLCAKCRFAPSLCAFVVCVCACVPNYQKENYIHTPTTTHQNIYYHTVHKAGNTKVPHVRVQRYMLCAKCRFAPSLDLFAQNLRMARIHTLHITCLTKCMVQCAVYRLTSGQ